MNFDYSPKVQELRSQLTAFMQEHVYPNEHKWEAHVRGDRRWEPVPVIEELKAKARAKGLWNLWRPKSHGGTLTNLEYAPLCEIMGRSPIAPEVFNCSAPDTGNMEVLERYGTDAQKKTFLPLIAEAGVSAIPNPLINIAIQGRHDTYPKRRGMTRVPEMLKAGIRVGFGQRTARVFTPDVGDRCHGCVASGFFTSIQMPRKRRSVEDGSTSRG